MKTSFASQYACTRTQNPPPPLSRIRTCRHLAYIQSKPVRKTEVVFTWGRRCPASAAPSLCVDCVDRNRSVVSPQLGFIGSVYARLPLRRQRASEVALLHRRPRRGRTGMRCMMHPPLGSLAAREARRSMAWLARHGRKASPFPQGKRGLHASPWPPWDATEAGR